MATARPSPQLRTEALPAGAETARPLPAEERRHLRVVKQGEKLRPRLRLTPRAGIAVTVLLFVALFAVAASHALLIEGQGRLDRLDQQVGDAQSQYESLQVQVANLEAPPRIREEAEALGMVEVEPDEISWRPQSQAISRDTDTEPTEVEAPGTSYPDVKPYLDTTP